MPTLREQTLVKFKKMPPLSNPRAQGRAHGCNWRAVRKTAAPALSCIRYNCDLMEQSGNASTHFHSKFCKAPVIVHLALTIHLSFFEIQIDP